MCFDTNTRGVWFHQTIDVTVAAAAATGAAAAAAAVASLIYHPRPISQ